MTSNAQARIASLTRLIDHAKTGAAEKRVAEIMRAKLQAKQGPRPARQPDGFYGEKYGQTKKLTLTEIAKLIRADIKVAMKAARLPVTSSGGLAVIDPFTDVPAEVKVSVTTRYYSGGGAIDIRVKNVPREWAWTSERVNGYDRDVLTPAGRAFRQALTDIHMSYNRDNSDVTSDYFDRRFYGHVTIDRRPAV